jgi:hypothetical protein
MLSIYAPPPTLSLCSEISAYQLTCRLKSEEIVADRMGPLMLSPIASQGHIKGLRVCSLTGSVGVGGHQASVLAIWLESPAPPPLVHLAVRYLYYNTWIVIL